MENMHVLPTNSQKKVINFYMQHTDKFNNILKIEQSTDCIITITTKNIVYKIGRLGGVTTNF
jgi:hypothetical protein